MELELHRFDGTDHRTISKLSVNGLFECFGLEDTIRQPGVKIPGQTAIPAGRYRVDVTFSNRFQRMLPVLLDVPNFLGIRIHAGNTEADTEGCILVGQHRLVSSILDSRLALGALLPKISGALARHEDVWITVVNNTAFVAAA